MALSVKYTRVYQGYQDRIRFLITAGTVELIVRYIMVYKGYQDQVPDYSLSHGTICQVYYRVYQG